MIGIVDYGVGNVFAFTNMYKRMNIPCRAINRVQDLSDVDKIILPGVGSFDFAMSKLNESGLREGLQQAVLEAKKPVLGICVGMQMLADASDEGDLPGLGWIPGQVRKFSLEESDNPIRLPHMGWNNFSVGNDSQLLREIGIDAWFYFLHSYYFSCSNATDELASCNYGIQFSCAVNRENVFGVQFHPEKSHDHGARLLRNFSEIE